jgi:hypothetical protein
VTAPDFSHLLNLTTSIGTFEHACYSTPRIEHGYCVDDVARVLIVAMRQPGWSTQLHVVARTSSSFLSTAQDSAGRIVNRCDANGVWSGAASVDDCWGRALWAFGTAAVRAPTAALRRVGADCFARSAPLRSPHRRAMAFAGLGAAEVLALDPTDRVAAALLEAAADAMGRASHDLLWPWPEPRLAYANAAIPEVLIAAGHLLGRPALLDDGLVLLRWLLDRETVDHHLSPTPVDGAGPRDAIPRFDQQPIEVAALADACARAHAVTGDEEWMHGLRMAVAWFDGDNDLGVPMYDPATGGGYDGLGPDGPNLNQGAESTLAWIATAQHASAHLVSGAR